MKAFSARGSPALVAAQWMQERAQVNKGNTVIRTTWL